MHTLSASVAPVLIQVATWWDQRPDACVARGSRELARILWGCHRRVPCQARWWVECWICKTVRPCKTARYARKKCKVSRKWKGQRWLEASFGKLWMKQNEIHSGDVPHVMIDFIWFYDIVKLNSHTCTLSKPCYSEIPSCPSMRTILCFNLLTTWSLFVSVFFRLCFIGRE